MTRITPRALLGAWNLARRHGVDVFRSGAARALRQLPGWSGLDLPQEGIDDSAAVTLLDALRGLALLARDQRTESDALTDLVATLPSPDSRLVSTEDAIRVMVEGAKASLLVIGFEIRDAQFRQALARKAISGVAVTVVGDRETRSAREFKETWPAIAKPLRALESIEPAGGGALRLHAKIVVADSSSALVGSANFTSGGLRRNIEFGLRTAGPAASEIVRTVDRLEREGWLQRIQ